MGLPAVIIAHQVNTAQMESACARIAIQASTQSATGRRSAAIVMWDSTLPRVPVHASIAIQANFQSATGRRSAAIVMWDSTLPRVPVHASIVVQVSITRRRVLCVATVLSGSPLPRVLVHALIVVQVSITRRRVLCVVIVFRERFHSLGLAAVIHALSVNM